MVISAFSPASIWNNATRTLTGIGATAMVTTSANHAALANGTSVDLRPAAAKMREINLSGEPLANVTWTLQTFDGSVSRNIVSFASGAGFMQVCIGTATIGISLANAGTVSGNYSQSGVDWTQ